MQMFGPEYNTIHNQKGIKTSESIVSNCNPKQDIILKLIWWALKIFLKHIVGNIYMTKQFKPISEGKNLKCLYSDKAS